jgi:starch synthase
VPEVVHAHDWHAAMACAYMPTTPAPQAASVFTVHNLAYQGLFPQARLGAAGAGVALMSPAALEFHGQLSLHEGGAEVRRPRHHRQPQLRARDRHAEFGCGLDGVIRSRGGRCQGILNGIDDRCGTRPPTRRIAQRYDADRLAGKQACRRAAGRASGWTPTPMRCCWPW